mmetsp:Transcript_1608/g.2299  ORF Transcript_1608/g.2299 Transcript_1608/m.2299 type:complete len:233 (+) Transcript_1608:341-1039(+)
MQDEPEAKGSPSLREAELKKLGMAFHGTIPHKLRGVHGQAVELSASPLRSLLNSETEGGLRSWDSLSFRGFMPESNGVSTEDNHGIKASAAGTAGFLEDVDHELIERSGIHLDSMTLSNFVRSGFVSDLDKQIKRDYIGALLAGEKEGESEIKVEVHADWGVNSVAWVKGRGGGIISGGDDGAVRMWDLTGSCVRFHQDHKHDESGGSIRTIYHSQDLLVVGGTDETVKIYK